jgi:phosphoribosyl-ATP pyrophosphohydrolase/phosphoribosyl-AMP cyclohydrolase
MSVTFNDVESLRWNPADGLIPVVVQDSATGMVLMQAWMNRDALRATLERGRVVFFSRSKQRLWEKGESSGHTLNLVDINTDCDQDSLLVSALPLGPTCHTGTTSCFGNEARSKAGQLAFLAKLQQIISQRMIASTDGSYTARLFASGTKRIAQKVGEEGLEVALAGVGESDVALLGESADLIYHLLVLLRVRGLGLEQVVAELQQRHAASSPARGSAS